MNGINVFDSSAIIKFLNKADNFIDLTPLTVLPIDGRIEAETIKIRRKTKLKLPDAIIAATTVVIGAELVSTDPHFIKCSYPTLKLWQP